MVKKSNPTQNKTKVFYDGSCALCSAEISYYQSKDSVASLEAIDVNSKEFRDLDILPYDKAMARFHVLSPDGHLLSGAEAFIEVWRGLAGWKWLARVADIPGITWLLERAYQIFLFMRPLFVRVFKCVSGNENRRAG